LASADAVFVSLIAGFTVTLSSGALPYLIGAFFSGRVGE